MAKKALKKCHIVMVGSWTNTSWTPENISKWVSGRAGTVQPAVDEDTTHVVASKRAWETKAPGVVKALEAIRDRKQKIKIVSDDWLDDSLKERSKKREGVYLWERLDGAVTADGSAASAKVVENGRTFAPGTLVGGETGYQAAEDSVTTRAQTTTSKNGRAFAPNGLLGGGKINGNTNTNGNINGIASGNASESEASNVSITPASRVPAVDPFLRGSKKARNEIFSANYHIYRDTTGFPYEISLTKVDIRTNRNERHTITLNLQLYESNSMPHLYACNVQYAATKQFTSNNILAPIGSPFAVAFRSFKQIFKEKTTVDWDQRINFSLKKKEAEAAGKATGQPGTLAVRQDGQWTFLDEADVEAMAFEDRPAEYAVPKYGTVGEVFKTTAQLLEEGQLPKKRQAEARAAKEQEERERASARQMEIDEACAEEARQEREALEAVEAMEQRETLDADEAWARAREAEMQIPRTNGNANRTSEYLRIEGEDTMIREVDGLTMMSGGIQDEDDSEDDDQKTNRQAETPYDEDATMREALAVSLAATTNGHGHQTENNVDRASLPASVGGFEADDELSSPLQPTVVERRDDTQFDVSQVAQVAAMTAGEPLPTQPTVSPNSDGSGVNDTGVNGTGVNDTGVNDTDVKNTGINDTDANGTQVAPRAVMSAANTSPPDEVANAPADNISIENATSTTQPNTSHQSDISGLNDYQAYPPAANTDIYEEYDPIEFDFGTTFDYGPPLPAEGETNDWDIFSNLHQSDVQPHQNTLHDGTFGGMDEMFGSNSNVQSTVDEDAKPGNDLFLPGLGEAAFGDDVGQLGQAEQNYNGDAKADTASVAAGPETQVAAQLHYEMMQAAETLDTSETVLGKRASPEIDDGDPVAGSGKRRKQVGFA